MALSELFVVGGGKLSTRDKLSTLPMKVDSHTLFCGAVWLSAEVELLTVAEMNPMHGCFKKGGAKQLLRFAPHCGQCLPCKNKLSCAAHGSSDKVNTLSLRRRYFIHLMSFTFSIHRR